MVFCNILTNILPEAWPSCFIAPYSYRNAADSILLLLTLIISIFEEIALRDE